MHWRGRLPNFGIGCESWTSGRAVRLAADIPEVIPNGYSEQQATEYAADAIALVLNEYIRRRRPIPAPSKPKRGMRLIPLPARTQAKLALYEALAESGMKKAELARRLGGHKFQVERLLDLTHASRIDQIEAALAVLGKKLYVNAAA
jgi:antitoxin HicB